MPEYDPFNTPDPNNIVDDGPTEFSWGAGLFPPGIADGEGQRYNQFDFGENLYPRTAPIGDSDDNYARAVADRRTDSTNPDSNRDFHSPGNMDRFGKNPPLVRERPVDNTSQLPVEEPNETPYAW